MIDTTQPPFPSAMIRKLRSQYTAPYGGANLLQEDHPHAYRVSMVKNVEDASCVLYELPQHSACYTMGVVAIENELAGCSDCSCVIVKMPGYQVVAHWYDTWTEIADLSAQIASIARYFDVAAVWIQATDTGEDLLACLVRHEGIDEAILPPILEAYEREFVRTRWPWDILRAVFSLARALVRQNRVCIPSRWIVDDLARISSWRFDLCQYGADLALPWLYAVEQAYFLR